MYKNKDFEKFITTDKFCAGTQSGNYNHLNNYKPTSYARLYGIFAKIVS